MCQAHIPKWCAARGSPEGGGRSWAEMLLEEINLRPEEKAFQTSALADLRAMASQAELLPRLHLQKANKQNCLQNENTASSLRVAL